MRVSQIGRFALAGALLVGLLAAGWARPDLVTWAVTPSPNVGEINMAVSATLGISNTEAWAAGTGIFDEWNGTIWNRISGAKLPPGRTFQVEAMAAIPGTSPVQIWAVGFEARTSRQMIERWDGSAWSVIPAASIPKPALSATSRLSGVSAISGTDAWAVGSDGAGGIAEHWNGAKWVWSPMPATSGQSTLTGVTVLSATNAWAVGYCFTDVSCSTTTNRRGGDTRPNQRSSNSRDNPPMVNLALIEHWNGSAWKVIGSPQDVGELNGVAARSPQNIWAVGAYDMQQPVPKYGILTEHWNGKKWRTISGVSPARSREYQTLQSVTVGSGRIWADGYFATPSGNEGLIEWWHGGKWHLGAEPHPANALDSLFSISATPAGGPIWAGGGHIEEWNGTTWTYTPAFNAGTDNSLAAITRIPGSAKLWTVGQFVKQTGSGALIERWNGQRWNVFADANLSNGVLAGVSAAGPGNAWAVGTAHGANNVAHGAIEHWNGSAWSLQRSPAAPHEWWESLDAVSARSPTDVWAAGYWYGRSGSQALVKHWNGKSWSLASTPFTPGTTQQKVLAGIVALGPNNVWAAGFREPRPGTSKTLIEHWNGTRWKVVGSPSPSSTSSLAAISADGPDDAWAVGQSEIHGSWSTLVEHWNGSVWAIAPAVNPQGVDDDLSAVSAVSPADVWAAGSYSTAQGERALVEHWNGVSWSVETVLTPENGGVLTGISAGVAAGSVWTAGSYANWSSVQRTLVEEDR